MSAGIRHIYVTDFGVTPLRPFQFEREADLRQRVKWKQHEDDLIGVPEVAPDNNLVHARMTKRARLKWERGE